MLPSQRDLFEIPRQICYLNSAPTARLRAPHVLSLAFKDGMPAGLVEGLASEGVYVAARLGRLRISPHVYNDEADADRFVAVLARRLRG
jgi:selenocysteine lyase/cysteine desulfurase